MAVTTSARNNGRGNQSVRFRVNKFKIFNSQNRTQQENADEEVLQEQTTQ
jgi:hypothetical protein